MIDTWVYAALAEHIYRRNSDKDQAISQADLAGLGGLVDRPDKTILVDLTLRTSDLNALGFAVSRERHSTS